MADYKISNLSIRVEDRTLPSGVLVGHGKQIGDLSDESSDSGGCGCSCSCTCSCTCTCTCTATSTGEPPADPGEPKEPDPGEPKEPESPEGGLAGKFENVELSVLRESLKGALENLEEIQRKRPEPRKG